MNPLPLLCTRVTSVYEDKRERALDGGIGGRQRVRSVLSSTLMFHPPSVLPNRHRSIHLTVSRSPLLRRGRRTLMKTLDQRRYETHSTVADDAGHGHGMLTDDCFPLGHNLTTCCYSKSGRRRLIYNFTTTDLSYFCSDFMKKRRKKKKRHLVEVSYSSSASLLLIALFSRKNETTVWVTVAKVFNWWQR